MLFVQARNYTPANREPGDISWIVIHDMEMVENARTAENCADYFKRTIRQASAHYCVDSDSVVQCVSVKDVAWAAPGANSRGIQIELAGFASQTKTQWQDAFGLEMLKVSAGLVRGLCQQYSIPIVFIGKAGLLRGERGITTHAQVSDAFKRSTHTDPGPNFPIDEFIKMVAVSAVPGKPVVASTPSRLVNVGSVRFWTFFPKWYSIREGSKFWAETIALQHRLNSYTTPTGLPKLTLDGVYGGKTTQFVKAYQYWIGLPKDGVCGPTTARALNLTK